MTQHPSVTIVRRLVVTVALLALALTQANAQMDANERVFPHSKAEVEKALKGMQAALGGRLPALDGFAVAEHPLDRYQRGYYQATVQIDPSTSGAVVRVSVKVTAWYSDPVGPRSGYQLLTSNGRLEADVLDQLAEQLGKVPVAENKNENSRINGKANGKQAEGAIIASSSSPTGSASTTSASTTPAPATSEKPAAANAADESVNKDLPSAFTQSLAAQERAMLRPAPDSVPMKANSQLQAEVDSLQEILKNQAHPKNLVAVKKSGTPVVGTPSLSAKPLFLASRHDEFEMLDFNEDWVHVRVSGLSRGWIWRNSLEMPDGIPDTAAHSGPSPSAAADLFKVTREETAPFPGDWQPLRGKNVKILSVQKMDEAREEGGPQDKLEYAKFILDKTYAEMQGKPDPLAGVVLIFDSADGGMIAATVATLQQWKAGAISDAALWHNCFFDPPETFGSAGSSGTQ